jgi:hypothetical protein
LSQVFRQYLQYGYWKPFVMRKHGQPASLRHLVPAAFVALLALAAVLAITGLAGSPFAFLVASYAVAVAAMTAGVAASEKAAPAVGLRVPAVIAAYHLGYGIGSLFGWWDVLVHGQGRPRFAALTR